MWISLKHQLFLDCLWQKFKQLKRLRCQFLLPETSFINYFMGQNLIQLSNKLLNLQMTKREVLPYCIFYNHVKQSLAKYKHRSLVVPQG